VLHHGWDPHRRWANTAGEFIDGILDIIREHLHLTRPALDPGAGGLGARAVPEEVAHEIYLRLEGGDVVTHAGLEIILFPQQSFELLLSHGAHDALGGAR
jgi:hypothetical protein